MRVIVIGLGSMGKRRIRLMKQLGQSIEIIGVDSRADRRKEATALFGIMSVNDLKTAFDMNCDCAFICTSPLAHSDLIENCLNNELHVFTEINLVDIKYNSNILLAKKKKKVLFLSSTFLYRDEIKYIQSKIDTSNSLLTYSYHVGQYLPDWHPWENYTDYFIGDERTSGCREIMAIDFPWIYKTFGKFTDIQVKKNKKTKLATSYCDSYLLLVEHECGVQGTIIVDVVSRRAERLFEVFGEDLHISWNGTADGLIEYDINNRVDNKVNLYLENEVDKLDEYSQFIVENAYKNEIVAFFEEVQGGIKAAYGFEDDKYILEIIDSIER